MSYYRERFGHREGEFPVCEDVAARSIALPFLPALSEGDVAAVAQALTAVARAGIDSATAMSRFSRAPGSGLPGDQRVA